MRKATVTIINKVGGIPYNTSLHFHSYKDANHAAAGILHVLSQGNKSVKFEIGNTIKECGYVYESFTIIVKGY